ncbi:MAG: hypothetical protein LBU05_00420, partial [Bifidobacteriaceae bacterium]|nr:hypothetical protein [Bifidobacteriaceae bacterium]
MAAGSAVFWLISPGLAVALALRLRGWALVGLVPALSCGLVGAASLVAPRLGWNWGPAPILVVIALAGGLAIAVTARQRAAADARPGPAEGGLVRILGRRWPSGGWADTRRPAVVVTAGASAVAFALGWAGLRSAGAIPQGWDAVFHGNLVRFILDTGNASPLHAGTLNAPGSSWGYYPDVLHAIAALGPTSTQVWPALNLTGLVATSLAWVGGAAYLASCLFQGRPAVLAAAAVVAVAVQTGPAALVDQMPNALGLALLPGLLGCAAELLRGWSSTVPRGVMESAAGADTRSRAVMGARAAALLLGLGGAMAAHPGAAFSWAALVAPFAAKAWWTHLTAAWDSRRTVRAWAELMAPGLIAVLAGLVVWRSDLIRRMAESPGTPGRENPLAALAEGLTDGWSMDGFRPNLLVLVGVSAGALWCCRHRTARLLAVSHALALVLFVIAAAEWDWAAPITGFWFNDPNRLAGTLAVVVTPLTAAGLIALVHGWRAHRRERPSQGRIAPATHRTDRVWSAAGRLALAAALVGGAL